VIVGRFPWCSLGVWQVGVEILRRLGDLAFGWKLGGQWRLKGPICGRDARNTLGRDGQATFFGTPIPNPFPRPGHKHPGKGKGLGPHNPWLMRYLVLFVGLCGVASAALLARAGLDGGMSPVGLSAWRLLVASSGLLIWRVFSGRVVDWNSSDRLRAAGAGLFLALHFATWIASLNYISVARSTLLVATSPLWAGLFGLFVPSQRPGKSFWLGLAVAGIGIWIVTSQGAVWRGGQQAWLGDVLALVGAVCIIPYLMLSQRVQKTHGTVATVTWIYTSAAVCLWGVCFATRTASLPGSGAVWGSILGMAVFAQLIGHSSLNWSLKHFSAGQVSSTTLLEPVFAAGLAWPILGEAVSGWQAVGGVVLLLGVWVVLRPGEGQGGEEVRERGGGTVA
jgi:drug/metabolite transporter (DMT)-like permease